MIETLQNAGPYATVIVAMLVLNGAALTVKSKRPRLVLQVGCIGVGLLAALLWLLQIHG